MMKIIDQSDFLSPLQCCENNNCDIWYLPDGGFFIYGPSDEHITQEKIREINSEQNIK